MARKVFDWPAAWPGSGGTRLLTVARSGGRGLALAHRAGAPALLRKATLGADAAHPVRLWDVTNYFDIENKQVEIENRQEPWGGATGKDGLLQLLREKLASVDLDLEHERVGPAMRFDQWLTTEARVPWGWEISPALQADVSIYGSLKSTTYDLTVARVKAMLVGFPTVAAGCRMRLHAWTNVWTSASCDYETPSGGALPDLALRLAVRGVIGMDAAGVFPEEIETALLASRAIAIPTPMGDSAVTTIDEQLDFTVPDSRVAVVALEFVDPTGWLMDVYRALPFPEGEHGDVEVRHATGFGEVGEGSGLSFRPVAP